MRQQYDEIRQRACRLLEESGAHEGFENIVEVIPPEKQGQKAPGTTYTPWRLLEHMRRAQHDILEYIRDPDYESPPYPEGFWPSGDAPPSPEASKRSVEQFKADRKALCELVRDPANNITEQIPHAQPGHTILRQALLAADHNAFHLGELQVVNQLIGTFPKHDEPPDDL